MVHKTESLLLWILKTAALNSYLSKQIFVRLALVAASVKDLSALNMKQVTVQGRSF